MKKAPKSGAFLSSARPHTILWVEPNSRQRPHSRQARSRTKEPEAGWADFYQPALETALLDSRETRSGLARGRKERNSAGSQRSASKWIPRRSCFSLCARVTERHTKTRAIPEPDRASSARERLPFRSARCAPQEPVFALASSHPRGFCRGGSTILGLPGSPARSRGGGGSGGGGGGGGEGAVPAPPGAKKEVPAAGFGPAKQRRQRRPLREGQRRQRRASCLEAEAVS